MIICRLFYKEFIKTLFFFYAKIWLSLFFFLSFLKGSIRVSRRTRLRREIDAYSFETDNILRALPVPQPRRHTASGTRRNRSCCTHPEEKNLLSSARASSYCFVDHRFRGFFAPLLNFSVEEFVSNIKLIENGENRK